MKRVHINPQDLAKFIELNNALAKLKEDLHRLETVAGVMDKEVATYWNAMVKKYKLDTKANYKVDTTTSELIFN